MPRWVAFSALTLVVLAVVLLSARASKRVVSELAEPMPRSVSLPDGADHLDAVATGVGRADTRPSPIAMLANVGASHALLAAVLVAGVWLAEIPLSAIGVGTTAAADALVAGTGIGLAVAAANTLLGGLLDADPSAVLRELLAPDSPVGWVLLLLVVLPVIAGFEELLFRAILIGAFAEGVGLPTWFLAVGSSAVFAAGHGAQGRLGVAVTGAFGLVLAVAFVTTGSLAVVAIAHYVINAVEFVLAEGPGYEPFGST